MNRQEKFELIQDLESRFSKSNASFVINFQGMDVKQMEVLRREIKREGGDFVVAKARLGKRAYERIRQDGLGDSFFKQQVGFVFTAQDGSSLAKSIHGFSQKNKALSVVGCMVGNHTYDNIGFVRLAELPSKNILVSQLCGVLRSPVRNCVGVLNMITARLLLVLQQVAANK